MSKKVISFYDSGKPYYEFTNFYLSSININEVPENLRSLGVNSDLTGKWKTSEHLFQAAKFTDSEIIKEIQKAQTPREVYILANGRDGRHERQIRPDWRKISVEVMHWVVKEKFSQNEDLKKMLLETGDAELIEDSGDKDKFWGNGVKGNGINYPFKEEEGKNKLGKILEKVRDELATNQRSNSNSTPPPKKQPTNPSQPTTPDNGNSNSPNQTDSQNSNNNSPETDQSQENESNSSTTNSNGQIPNPVDNDNSDKGSDKDNNDNFPSQNSDSPTLLQTTPQQSSTLPINVDEINNAETLEKSQQIARQQIQKLFAKSKVRPSELGSSLWKAKGSWEEYLKEIKSKQELTEFVQILAIMINKKADESNKTDLSNNPNSSNKVLILSLTGGILLISIIGVFIFKRFKKRKK